jgi:hypothetical protein
MARAVWIPKRVLSSEESTKGADPISTTTFLLVGWKAHTLAHGAGWTFHQADVHAHNIFS